MADFEKQNRLRKLQRANFEELPVSNRAKSVGFGCFSIGMVMVGLFFSALSIALAIQHFLVSAILLGIFGLGILWITFQLWRADK